MQYRCTHSHDRLNVLHQVTKLEHLPIFRCALCPAPGLPRGFSRVCVSIAGRCVLFFVFFAKVVYSEENHSTFFCESSLFGRKPFFFGKGSLLRNEPQYPTKGYAPHSGRGFPARRVRDEGATSPGGDNYVRASRATGRSAVRPVRRLSPGAGVRTAIGDGRIELYDTSSSCFWL